MKITNKQLITKLTEAAKHVVNEDEAHYFAEETVEAYIRKSPRTNPLKSSVDDLETAFMHKDEKLNYKVDLPSFVSIDFNGSGPLVYIKQIHDELEARSKKTGIAMAAFTNSKSMHTLHTWVQGLAKRGLVAIAICNGGPGAVVPYNGSKGLFGTNPLAYGLPGKNGEIFCVDMATSEIPYFEILTANKRDNPLPDRSAVDSDGEFTTDASKALDYSESETDPISNIVPMGGGYKGYYIVYLMEILTSGLISMPSSPQMSPDFVPEEHGATLIVFNPKAMGSSAALVESIQEINKAVKAQKPKSGTQTRLPGEGNNQKFFKANGKDLEVDDALLERINKL